MKNNIDSKVLKLVENYEKKLSPNVEKAWVEFQNRKDELPTGKVVKRNFFLPLTIAASFLLVIGFYLSSNSNTSFQNKKTLASETAQFDLPDGSKIWMNENSTISHFSNAGDIRNLEMKGEIFFDVARDQSNPFVIKTNGVTIKVIGTAFNIKNMEQYVEVEVKSGLVEVNGKEIKPGQRIIVERDGSFEIDAGKNIGGWINKDLNFDKTALSLIINEIEEIYDVKIAVRNTALNECLFSTEFNNESIENILEILKTGFGCELKKVTDQAYVLKGGSCR